MAEKVQIMVTKGHISGVNAGGSQTLRGKGTYQALRREGGCGKAGFVLKDGPFFPIEIEKMPNVSVALE